jgi:putative sterol carrier protein
MELNIFETLEAKLKKASSFNGTVKLILDSKEIFHFDGQTKTLTREDKPADCTLYATTSDFMSILQGQLNPVTAFMTGKLRVEGALSVAMELSKLL